MTLLYKADYGNSGVNILTRSLIDFMLEPRERVPPSKTTGCEMATVKDNYKCFIRVYNVIGQVYLSSLKKVQDINLGLL